MHKYEWGRSPGLRVSVLGREEGDMNEGVGAGGGLEAVIYNFWTAVTGAVAP